MLYIDKFLLFIKIINIGTENESDLKTPLITSISWENYNIKSQIN